MIDINKLNLFARLKSHGAEIVAVAAVVVVPILVILAYPPDDSAGVKWWRVSKEAVQQLIGILGIFVAAFVGAFSAFKLNNRKDLRAVEQAQANALRSALFRLFRMQNSLMLQQKYIASHPQDDMTGVLMKPAKIVRQYNFKIDVASIEFLLAGDNPQLLQDVLIEEERYESAMFAADIRADFHLNKLQPAMEKANYTQDKPTQRNLCEAVGPVITAQAISAYNGFVMHVEETLKSMPSVTDNLLKEAKRLFPDHPMIQFDTQPADDPNATSAEQESVTSLDK